MFLLLEVNICLCVEQELWQSTLPNNPQLLLLLLLLLLLKEVGSARLRESDIG